MKIAFKKWIWSKELIINNKFQTLWNGEIINIDNIDIPLEILIKAMWKINREGTWKIKSQPYNGNYTKYIIYKVINHSTGQCGYAKEFKQLPEQQALQKALEYIYEKTNKKE